ncbi:sigma-70 family RNA polymerase sigma factor [Streptosporangium sp. NPDC049304]|uniref:RNA polymerase sigma factor n=1 Tax=Streptosporangium sp. NPDC049304 TaxID=3154830 RepID=UPI0034407477
MVYDDAAVEPLLQAGCHEGWSGSAQTSRSVESKAFPNGTGVAVVPPVQAEVAAFYAREAKKLVGFVMRLGTDDPELAADIVQATFLDALAKWDTIREHRAWIRRVAERKLMNAKKRTRLREDPVADLPDVERVMAFGHRSELLRPDVAFELSEQMRQVVRMIAKLPRGQRTVLAWHLDGYNNQEIAKGLRMTPGAVRQNLTRAKTALKIAHYGGEA